MLKTKKFKKEFLQDILFGNPTPSYVDHKIVRTTDWSIVYSMVFRYNDNYYQIEYSCGATELQNHTPFEYAPNNIECTHVEQKEVIVKQWVPI